MILRIEDLNDVCSKLLFALDTNSLFEITETLEMKNESGILTLAVTNKEYIVKCKIPTFSNEDFHVTVNADIFLKLMSKINTETVEFIVQDNVLIIKSNGTYKLPMIYNGNVLLELPDIIINNITSDFEINTSILQNIALYNSKELSKGVITNPVQKLYYIDNKGCITFTTGACVTSFTLPVDVKLLLNQKIVKLFKLFNDEVVNISIGEDVVDNTTQKKIKFKNSVVELTSIIPSEENLINSVPCDAIRKRATETYTYSAVINRNNLLSTINRLMLFANNGNTLRPYGKFEFSSKAVKIYDRFENNYETLVIENDLPIKSEEVFIVDFIDIKLTLDSMKDEFITMNFGNHQAVVIQRTGVYNVIPECILD